MKGYFFFSSRRRHTRLQGDWSSDVCSSDLVHVRREDDVRRQTHRQRQYHLRLCQRERGQDLVASGIVTSAKAIAKKRGIARQTPHASITVRRTALTKQHLGRSELKLFSDLERWST